MISGHSLMKQIIFAGSGYLGLATAIEYSRQGAAVYCLTRTPQKAFLLRQYGLQPVIADLVTGQGLDSLPEADAAFFCAAPDEGNLAGYESLYLQGGEAFVNALCRKKKPSKILYTSSTSVWGKNLNVAWVDETIDAVPDSEKGRILLASESVFLRSGIPCIRLRLAGLYGPGRNRIKALLERKWPRATRNSLVNFIHLSDAVKALMLCEEKGVPGEIYIGADGVPAPSAEVYEWLCRQLGLPVDFSFTKDPVIGKRCSNEKIRKLGMAFSFPDYREGYLPLLNSVSQGKTA